MTLYPEIEPYRHGMLEVGDGNLVYWEECGNPDGKPAVVLHGGPGSGCTPGARHMFDPDSYRSCCSTNADAGEAGHTPATRAPISVRTPPVTSWRTWSC